MDDALYTAHDNLLSLLAPVVSPLVDFGAQQLSVFGSHPIITFQIFVAVSVLSFRRRGARA